MYLSKRLAAIGNNALNVLYSLKELWPNNEIAQHLTSSTATARRSIELARDSTTRLNKSWCSALMKKLLQNTSYLQFGW